MRKLRLWMTAVALAVSGLVHADEGMWLLSTLKQLNEADMQRWALSLLQMIFIISTKLL